MKKIIFMLLMASSTTYGTPSLETAMEYQHNEQYTQAITCFEEIIYNEPYNPNALFSLGCCYLALGDYTKAINSFDAILAHSPQTLPAMYNKAFTYKTMGDVATAIALYQ